VEVKFLSGGLEQELNFELCGALTQASLKYLEQRCAAAWYTLIKKPMKCSAWKIVLINRSTRQNRQPKIKICPLPEAIIQSAR
jgi:hypothetical protein